MSKTIRLGLIGDNIAASRAPFLHETGGYLHGLDVVYERLVPREMGMGAAALMNWALDQGFAGLNITHPYKEVIARDVFIDDPLVAQMGAVNTLIFSEARISGFNTDCSGFVKAWSNAFPQRTPGRVALMGAGGVGRAVAFGLVALGAVEIRIFDQDRLKAEALGTALSELEAAPLVVVADCVALQDVGGVVNCTPVGMVGHEGTPVEAGLLPHKGWAFDAIYTPSETEFLRDAKNAGLEVLSGFELFFYQGVHAFKLFTGIEINQLGLRRALANRPG